MRLGAADIGDFSSPDQWISILKEKNYRSALSPVDATADDATVNAYRKAAKEADIVIAEVGVWNNPIDSDGLLRKRAIEKCCAQLELAERLEAKCCVNISGSRGEAWDGPDSKNFLQETFDMVVDSVRKIIDTVKPKRTFYTLEPLPWMIPDSPENYLDLLKAVDRKAFAVHMDYVNIITNPRLYLNSADFIRHCFRLLGSSIKSCHAKDIILRNTYTVFLEETRPGLGILDYRTIIREIDAIDPEMPLLLEHLKNLEDYRLAADHVRSAQ